MGSLIVYTKKCLACTDKPTWKRIKLFAEEHGLSLQERRVNRSQEWKKEASLYEIDLPFVLYNKNALSLKEDLKGLLNEK